MAVRRLQAARVRRKMACHFGELNDERGECRENCTLNVCSGGGVGPGEHCPPLAESPTPAATAPMNARQSAHAHADRRRMIP